MGIEEGIAKAQELMKHPVEGFDWINNVAMALKEASPAISREQINGIINRYSFNALQNHTTLTGYALDNDGYVRESHLDLNLCLEIAETRSTDQPFDDGDPPPADQMQMLRFQEIDKLPPMMNFKRWAEDSDTNIYLNPDTTNTDQWGRYLWVHRKVSGEPEIWNSINLADRIHADPSGALEWWYPNGGPNWDFEKALSRATHWAGEEFAKWSESRRKHPVAPLPFGDHSDQPVQIPAPTSQVSLKSLIEDGMKAFGEAGAWNSTWKKNLRQEGQQHIRTAELQPLRPGQQRAFNPN